jgi:hypothetical protein
VLSPRWHGETWLLAWRLTLDLRMLGLRSDHVGGMDPRYTWLRRSVGALEACGGGALDPS